MTVLLLTHRTSQVTMFTYNQPPVSRLASESLIMLRVARICTSQFPVLSIIGYTLRDGTYDLTLRGILLHQLMRLNNLFPREHFLNENLERTILELREISTFTSQQLRPRHAKSRDFLEHTLPTYLSASPDIPHPDSSNCFPQISTSSSQTH